jgi:hypothetical protein
LKRVIGFIEILLKIIKKINNKYKII